MADLVLTDKNFMLYAARNYRNPRSLDPNEFRSDLSHMKYAKKLIKTYLTTGELQTRLILNHLIIFFNMFEPEAAVKMLFFRMKDEAPQIKTFLLFMNYLPEIGYEHINTDLYIACSLRKI